MKKDFAIFTIVQNEKYFLPKLIKYYTQYIAPEDFYILDHDTTDRSTDNLSVNVEKVSYQFSFDHAWLVKTVQGFQKKLLSKYKYVIFVESDDFLYNLEGDFISTLIDTFKNYNAIINIGYNIIHDYKDSESSSNFDITNDEFMTSCVSKRSYWSRKPNHDKALVVNTPCNYTHGFHGFSFADKSSGFKSIKLPSLFLAHLHTVDWKLNAKRITHRINDKKFLKNDSGAPHNKSMQEQENHFNFFLKSKEEIPSNHKLKMIQLGI